MKLYLVAWGKVPDGDASMSVAIKDIKTIVKGKRKNNSLLR